MKRLIQPILALMLVVTLAACGGDDQDDPTPTTEVSGQVTQPAGGIEIPAGERPDGDFSGLTQRLLFDGCRVVMPMEWTSFGDRTGSTVSGANFTINGGPIASDTSWERAVQLVAQQAMRRGAGPMIRGDDWVYAELADGRGFTFRIRFENRFCDVAVQGTTGAPGTERAAWPAIIGSVEPEPMSD